MCDDCLSFSSVGTNGMSSSKIPRDDLCLLWELSASGKPVKEALNPSRAVEHLDRLLTYHGLSYIDVFMLEIPCFQGGEVKRVYPR